MLPYTTAKKNLIKSNLHTGANLPNVTVTISGQPVDIINVVSIKINPVKNGAGVVTIVLDNKNGRYSPDKTGQWQGIMWPNHDVVVGMGYGANIETVFTGSIDTIDMSTFPQMITLIARDNLKRAIDQVITDDEGNHKLSYKAMYIEQIFRDLAVRAGWSSGDIHVDLSGVQISINFAYISYADAMAKICELYNYEMYADRYGDVWFNYVTDRQPEQKDEAVSLSGTTAVNLSKYPIVTGSIRVRSSSGDGGTLYTKNTDYIITEGTKNTAWRITRVSGGSIPSGATVYVSYVYAAWVFEEGKDVASLSYRIEDAEIYRSVTVQGKTAAGLVCRGSANYSAANYYELPAQKKLIIQDESASTSTECTVIATRTVAAFAASPRKVSFKAVGNPYIEVGDCIMVIESSSTISEIYRISSLAPDFRPQGKPIYTIDITAYHYGYAPA